MLQYSIMSENLYGSIDGVTFSMKAYSGGGRGSKAGLETTDLKHWNTAKKAPSTFSADNRGGPIPTGHYIARYIGPYKHFGECARLDQTLTSLLQRDYGSSTGMTVTDRDSFLIHGQGPKGSDGCIVPASPTQLHELLQAIKGSLSPVLLFVHSPGMNSEKLQLMRSSAGVA